MENTLESKKKSKAAIVESMVVAFAIAYGLHYVGFFLRVRYFNIIDSFNLSEGAGHVLMYSGHIVFFVIMMLYALAVKRDRKYMLAFLPSRGNRNLMWLLLGAATGFTMMGICILAASLNGNITVNPGDEDGYFLVIAGLFTVFLQASTEEIESRGFLFGKMKGEGVPVPAAILVSSFFFAYLHEANPGFGLIPMLSIFTVGMFYALCYHFTGNLWFSCGAHTLWNYSQDFLFGLPDSGKPAAVSVMDTTVNSGGFFYDTVFGIEGSLMAICLNCVACLVVILIGKRLKKN